ncbi:MAG: leucine-rich repeat protein [Lachnospiraceae bacterium]|nr:leucine-rich repeat protein [Lachnospiraceae bacterium]
MKKRITNGFFAVICILTMAISLLPAGKVTAATSATTDFAYKSYDNNTITITGYLGKGETVMIPSYIDNKPVTTVAAGAFSSNTTVKEVFLPKVTTVQTRAFYNCTALTTVWFSSVTEIGDSAFEGCSRLSDVVLPTSLTTIGADAFLNCPYLTTLEVPASVTTMGTHCFGYGSAGYTNYTLYSNTTMICASGSAAYTYATANKIKADTGKSTNPNLVNLNTCTVNTIADQTYTGNELTPAVTVLQGTTTLVLGKDYTVTYSNNKNIGTATVTVTGMGNYTGTLTKTFQIVKESAITITASNKYKTYSDQDKTFNLNATITSGATVTYESTNDSVMVDSTGKVTIEGGFSGTAIVKITATLSGYNTVSKEITITVPKAVTLTSATRSTSTTSKVTWKENSDVTGYYLQYSTKSDFSSDLNKKFITGSTTSRTLSDLTIGKKYYVRIRTYIKDDTFTYYSAWSNPKTIDATPSDKTLYKEYLSAKEDEVQEILNYRIFDINKDGTKELFYRYYNGGTRNCGRVCTIKNGKVVSLLNIKGGSPNFYNYTGKSNSIMVEGSSSSSKTSYTIYTLKNGNLTKVNTYVKTVSNSGSYSYTLNGKSIKKAQFTTMKKACKKLKTYSY